MRLQALWRVASSDCAAMEDNEFLKVFDFQYTESQWEQIERLIDAWPGKHDKRKIQETLELMGTPIFA